jgi:hypothetical protein
MELLATFEALSLAVLQDYVSRQQEENLQLDFKTLTEPKWSGVTTSGTSRKCYQRFRTRVAA